MRCVVQVMGESFWAMGKGPNQWAATLRWLAFSDSTLPLAAKEANRALRLLSLGGDPAVMAGCSHAFQVHSVCQCLHSLCTLFSQAAWPMKGYQLCLCQMIKAAMHAGGPICCTAVLLCCCLRRPIAQMSASQGLLALIVGLPCIEICRVCLP